MTNVVPDRERCLDNPVHRESIRMLLKQERRLNILLQRCIKGKCEREGKKGTGREGKKGREAKREEGKGRGSRGKKERGREDGRKGREWKEKEKEEKGGEKGREIVS